MLTVLRISLGWVMLYAGVTKLIDPSWSAAEYLKDADTFGIFFEWLASPAILPIVNQLNQWGLTLIGAALILGALVQWASAAGILLMFLYWLPVLDFPYAGHSFIIDDHIIYALVFALLIATNAGRIYGVDALLRSSRHGASVS